MVDKKLKCKLCKKDFTEREGLEGLKICQECDDSGRSGVASRNLMGTTRGGSYKVATVLYVAPGTDTVI